MSLSKVHHTFETHLKALEDKGLLRQLSRPDVHLKTTGHIPAEHLEQEERVFCSNDYLGLRRHPALVDACAMAARDFGTGSGASRLMSGNCPLFETLEQETAGFKGSESCLVFGSGYSANVGVFSAILNPGDAVFADELSHASIMDGILLSRARFFRFRHNDLDHLETLLKNDRQQREKRVIVAETIYSMDGDQADIAGLLQLKNQHETLLALDEAHAFGVFGQNGEGLVSHSLAKDVDIQVVTFGKAFGGYGAAVLCSELIKRYLINTARSFIFSTALPPPVLGTNLAALRLMPELNLKRSKVLKLAELLRHNLAAHNITTRGNSQIVPVILGDNSKAVTLANHLFEQGLFVKAVRPPAVPENTSRLRLSITAIHTQSDIENLTQHIFHGLDLLG